MKLFHEGVDQLLAPGIRQLINRRLHLYLCICLQQARISSASISASRYFSGCRQSHPDAFPDSNRRTARRHCIAPERQCRSTSALSRVGQDSISPLDLQVGVLPVKKQQDGRHKKSLGSTRIIMRHLPSCWPVTSKVSPVPVMITTLFSGLRPRSQKVSGSSRCKTAPHWRSPALVRRRLPPRDPVCSPRRSEAGTLSMAPSSADRHPRISQPPQPGSHRLATPGRNHAVTDGGQWEEKGRSVTPVS
jgi:hypothetical protein